MGKDNKKKSGWNPNPELLKKILDHRQIKSFNSSLNKYKGQGLSFREATKKALGDIDPNVDWRSQVGLLIKEQDKQREKSVEEARKARFDPGAKGRASREKSKDLSLSPYKLEALSALTIPSTPYRAFPRILGSTGDVTAGGRHPRSTRAGSFDLSSAAHPFSPLYPFFQGIGREFKRSFRTSANPLLDSGFWKPFIDPIKGAYRAFGAEPLPEPDARTREEKDAEFYFENRLAMESQDPDVRADYLESLTDDEIALGYGDVDELRGRVLADQTRRTRGRIAKRIGRKALAVSPLDRQRFAAKQRLEREEAVGDSPTFMATKGGIYPHRYNEDVPRYVDPRTTIDFDEAQRIGRDGRGYALSTSPQIYETGNNLWGYREEDWKKMSRDRRVQDALGPEDDYSSFAPFLDSPALQHQQSPAQWQERTLAPLQLSEQDRIKQERGAKLLEEALAKRQERSPQPMQSDPLSTSLTSAPPLGGEELRARREANRAARRATFQRREAERSAEDAPAFLATAGGIRPHPGGDLPRDQPKEKWQRLGYRTKTDYMMRGAAGHQNQRGGRPSRRSRRGANPFDIDTAHLYY